MKRRLWSSTQPHIAIALLYRPPEIAIPVVLIRAADEGAREIRRQAQRFGIPLVESIDVARWLYAHAEEGGPHTSRVVCDCRTDHC